VADAKVISGDEDNTALASTDLSRVDFTGGVFSLT
jgi:hypothetical protein